MKGRLALIALVFAALLLTWGAVYYAETANNAHAVQYAEYIHAATTTLWEFIRPLLQLIIVLIVVQWFLEKRGIHVSFTQLGLAWDARLLVALIVILTFCLVSLSGMDDRGIKEAALVVIGFYFGSAKKRDEMRGAAAVSTAPRQQGGSSSPPSTVSES